MTATQDEISQARTLVEVRGQRWGTGEEPFPGREASTLPAPHSVEDGWHGESLSVIRQVEPGCRVLPRRCVANRYGEIGRHNFPVAAILVLPHREVIR